MILRVDLLMLILQKHHSCGFELNEPHSHYQNYFPPVAAYLVEAQIKNWVGPSVAKILGLTDDFLKDEFVKGVNAITEFKNKNFFKGDSYEVMMQDHLRLKNIFQK